VERGSGEEGMMSKNRVCILTTSDLRDHPEVLDRAIDAGCDVRVATTRDTLCPSDDWWREKVDDLKIYMGQRALLPHATRRTPENMHLVYGYRGWMRLYRELMGRDFGGEHSVIKVTWALREHFLCGQDFRDPEIQAAVRVLPMNRMHAFAIGLPWQGGEDE